MYDPLQLNNAVTPIDTLWQQQRSDLDTINRARVNYLYGTVWGYTLHAYPIEQIVWMVNESISEGHDAR